MEIVILMPAVGEYAEGLVLSATETSIHASRVSAATVSDRVAHAETSKIEDTWHEALRHCDAGFDSTRRVFKGW